MSTMEAVVVIVALVMFARVLRERIRSDRAETPFVLADSDALTRENAALRRDLAALTDRVKVLERIATDGRHSGDLAAEIEALRDR